MSTRLYNSLSNEDKNEALHQERTDLMAFWKPPAAFGSLLLACGSVPKGSIRATGSDFWCPFVVWPRLSERAF